MSQSLPAKVGQVKIYQLAEPSGKQYADRAEDQLLELFSDHNPKSVVAKRRALLASEPGWAIYYHLSPVRKTLLRWYDFPAGSRVLEVGAGCGAITEELVSRDISVSALELTAKRALVNAHRNHTAKNLEVIAGNLDDYRPIKPFDFVVCVGVLEYAGTFTNNDSPYQNFLEKIASFLTPQGKLLLAIENRFGLKYWAGSREDHSRSLFEGHNGYPHQRGVQTFGKAELSKLLRSSGFTKQHFYYPYPDYKTPFFVFSDDYYPGHGATFPLGRSPAPAFDRPREHFFSEQNAMRYIEANKLYPDLANSFLVEATK